MVSVARNNVQVASYSLKYSCTVVTATGSMQKSKSSSSVVQQGKQKLTKKIFKPKFKSQVKPGITTLNWTPQGSCVWNSVTGRQVLLGDTPLLQLTEIERTVLQKIALAKLQALNLGVTVKLPTDSVSPVANKPKRRPYLLKRKALTTGIFDTSRKDCEKEKDGSTSGGLVFGIPLSQCVENDRMSRLASSRSPFRSRGELSGSDEPVLERHASRASFSSLIDAARREGRGSCESLMGMERMVGSVPGLLDALSSGSTTDIVGITTDEEPSVPDILTMCIKHLEAHGLHTLGIFRVSTSKKRIRQLREDFDCGKETTLDEEQCPHDVATLIKEYLRELPDPLLCRDLYHAFVHTQRIRNRRLQLEALQHLIQLLPPANRDTLYTLLNFLSTVAKYSVDYKNELGEEVPGNKMDSNNLATVFAPNVLHCSKPGSKDNSGDDPEDRIDVINVIRTLIDHSKDLFAVPAELMDEIYVHMMDSHPEALAHLLTKRDSGADPEECPGDLESESNSTPWTAISSPEQDHPIQKACYDGEGLYTTVNPRRTYSREEFLHESAATGGPNVAMRIRHKDKFRDKSRKRRDEATAGISKMYGREDDDNSFSKKRSWSAESYSDENDAMRISRISDDEGSERRKSSPYLHGSDGIVTATLTIPVQTGNQNRSLKVDDDIPYIEDGSSYVHNTDGKQVIIGVTKSPVVPPRRRQRSMSGSDLSISSNAQTTGTSSINSLAVDMGVCSANTSPDNQNINFIADDIQNNKTAKLVSIQKASSTTKESPTLQKVTFTTTSELQKAKMSNEKQNQNKSSEIQKSASSPGFAQEREQSKFSTSITSIGNAVLRSRTADFERIAKTDHKTEPPKKPTPETKKYTKRRYTDSRHQTRHIPDAESLEAASSSVQEKNERATSAQNGPVYKRRELISSVPSK